jgi:signal recognition particle subunit SRP19
MRKSSEIMLWAAYFDATKTRREGRRIDRKLAVERPTVEELAKAVELLKIPYKIDKTAAYPKAWWEKGGRLFIGRIMSKAKMMVSIAKNLKKVREKGGP